MQGMQGVVLALCWCCALYEEMCRAAKGGVASTRLPKRNVLTEGPLRTHPNVDSTCCLRVSHQLADRPRLGGEASYEPRAVSR
jgi:hypothetical protein